MKHERYSQRLGNGTAGIGDQMKNWDHPDRSNGEIIEKLFEEYDFIYLFLNTLFV